MRIRRTEATTMSLLFAVAISRPIPAIADPPSPAEGVVRFATFNASLNRDTAGGLVRDLATPGNAQARP